MGYQTAPLRHAREDWSFPVLRSALRGRCQPAIPGRHAHVFSVSSGYEDSARNSKSALNAATCCWADAVARAYMCPPFSGRRHWGFIVRTASVRSSSRAPSGGRGTNRCSAYSVRRDYLMLYLGTCARWGAELPALAFTALPDGSSRRPVNFATFLILTLHAQPRPGCERNTILLPLLELSLSAGATMSSPQLAIAKVSFSAVLLRPDPVSCPRSEIDQFLGHLDTTLLRCSPANVQV